MESHWAIVITAKIVVAPFLYIDIDELMFDGINSLVFRKMSEIFNLLNKCMYLKNLFRLIHSTRGMLMSKIKINTEITHDAFSNYYS